MGMSKAQALPPPSPWRRSCGTCDMSGAPGSTVKVLTAGSSCDSAVSTVELA